MKVALVSSFCLDSTMPLAVHLAKQKVDLHLFAIFPKGNQNAFVTDFSKQPQPNGFIDEVVAKKVMGEPLFSYLSEIKTSFFVFPGGGKKNFFLKDIYYSWKLSNYLITGKFDIIHLIHTSGRFTLLLYHFLRKQKIVQTLHEVTNHSANTSSSNIKIFELLIKKSTPVIFNSYTSKKRFLSFRNSINGSKLDDNLYTMIRFSLYETYNYFPSNPVIKKSIDKSIPVIFHFGRIVPYKGIDILIDAIKIVQQNQKVHLIIAGAGEPYFNFDGIDSYEFFNYSISNEEIIEFIKSCTVVVCAYRSASQSGIPMTAFLFNKPIIASSVGGFSEIIDDNITGMLVSTYDSVSFANAIQKLISNSEMQKSMEANIGKKFNQGEFSWQNIAAETIAFYREYLKPASAV